MFGYAKDAENLLKMLEKNKIRAEKGAVIVGLNGEWGKGKTSYLNLMRSYADTRKDIILIRINVWQSHSYEDMAKKLLSAIAHGIDDMSLKNLINDYSKAIIDADISILSKLVRLVSIGKSRQPEELFDIVGEKIKELNKCLIVQVDDIDRLTGKEILYTMKFIRNIASFRNTFFIVAYDEEYLKKQLCELKIDKPYLEKIFNVIYPLPAVRKEEYIDIVKNELVNSLMIDADVEKVIDEFMEVIEGNISLRNAKCLASSVQCGLSMLKDEDGDIMLDLLDYILVQYLQQINKRAYDFLSGFRHDNHPVTDKSIVYGSHIYINREEGFGSHKKVLSDEEYKKNRLIKDVGEENIELTFRIFQKMFDNNRKAVLGISFASSFPLYFKRTFDKKLIKKKDFLKSAKLGVEAFSKNLRQWYDGYDRFTLRRLIYTYDKCDTEEEWLHFFEAILEITPRSYLELLHNLSDGNFIPTPGLGLITERNRKNIDVLCNAINTFFFEKKMLELDSLEILQKKFTLLVTYEGYRRYSYYYTNKIKSFDKCNFKLYWEMYWKKTSSYNDFYEDLWLFINDNLYLKDKLDMREVARNHIKENINSFIENYPIMNMSDYYALQTLFTEYIVDGNRASEGDEWELNFIEFLNSIEPKSETIDAYIDDFRKYLKKPSVSES